METYLNTLIDRNVPDVSAQRAIAEEMDAGYVSCASLRSLARRMDWALLDHDLERLRIQIRLLEGMSRGT